MSARRRARPASFARFARLATSLLLAAALAVPTVVPAEERPADEWIVVETDSGTFLLNLFEELTPDHAENFKKLVRQGWYDGTPFHRVIPGFMAQGGGRWDEEGRIGHVGYDMGHEIRAELRHVRGSLAAARLGNDSNPSKRSSGSQFFICYDRQAELDGEYTIFGQVILGMEAVEALHRGSPGSDGAVEPEKASRILRAWIRPSDPPGSAHPEHADHH